VKLDCAWISLTFQHEDCDVSVEIGVILDLFTRPGIDVDRFDDLDAAPGTEFLEI
jgi:hypothetical protein